MARQIRSLGGQALLLPGLALRMPESPAQTRLALEQALQGDVLIFVSPSAVRFAAQLSPLKTHARIFAVGRATAKALQRHGLIAIVPTSPQNSEGLLALPALAALNGQCVALIGAPGGRDLLRHTLQARGAIVREMHVYRRVAPRLDRRHLAPLRALPDTARMLLSSGEALRNLQQSLPGDVWQNLLRAELIVSSARLAEAARAAGFTRITQAISALAKDMLAAAQPPCVDSG